MPGTSSCQKEHPDSKEERDPPSSSQPGYGGCQGSDGGNFECNVCLDLAQDPVITLCGHLFCWPCLYKWLRIHDSPKECPVCKAGVDEDKVIPLYGRGNTKKEDPRKKAIPEREIPTRPQGQRPPPTRGRGPYSGFNFGGGFGGPYASTQFGNVGLSAGFGFFPGLFGFQFQTVPFGEMNGGAGGERGMAGRQQLTPEQQQQAQLSKLLLFVGSFVILCLLFF